MATVEPVVIAPGTHLSGIVGKVFGANYATVFLSVDGRQYECPVMVGALLIHDDYKAAWDAYIGDVVRPGMSVEVLITGASFTTSEGRIPIIDIMDNHKTPLSVQAVKMGWAVPNEVALRSASDRSDYIAAVRAARGEKAGQWGDEVLLPTVGHILSPAFLQETQPAFPGYWETWRGPAFIVLMLLLLFMAWQRWLNVFDPVEAALRRQRAEEMQGKPFYWRYPLRSAQGVYRFALGYPAQLLPLIPIISRWRKWNQHRKDKTP
jgi:hypothetical protein